MPRRLRVATGGLAYHVLNRAVGRALLFRDDDDYQAMIRILERTHERHPIRILSYCLMPNHWHLVLWPQRDGQLSEFMRLLTVTHTQRWHAHHHTSGTGPLYQGRFKSFPIQRDDHLLTVCRYVERNPIRAKLAGASAWPWSSLQQHRTFARPDWLLPAIDWPVSFRRDWVSWVKRPQTQGEVDAITACVRRGRPFGDDRWRDRTAAALGLESTLRPRGRQRIHPIKDSRPAL